MRTHRVEHSLLSPLDELYTGINLRIDLDTPHRLHSLLVQSLSLAEVLATVATLEDERRLEALAASLKVL